MAGGKAVILFGHGSRDPAWRAPMDALAARIRMLQPGVPVCCAFLELQQPDLAAAAQQLVAGGARAITVLPLFIGIGRHARQDLPGLVAALRLAWPEVAFTLQPAAGEHPQVLELLAKIALE